MSSRIAGNDRLGLGSSKIEVLAKNSKKNDGTFMIFLVFPACGVGFLTSCSEMLAVIRKLLSGTPFWLYSIEGPQGGETAAPLFILGDFVEAFVGGRSPFEEVAL